MVKAFLNTFFLTSIILVESHEHTNPYGQPKAAGGANDPHQHANVEQNVKQKPLWNYYGKDLKIDLDHVLEETKNVISLQEGNQITQSDAAFYFHRLHDFNIDGYLDGLELLHAVRHSLIYSNSTFETNNLESLEKSVDTQLEYFDFNGDGLVEYGELMKYLNDHTTEVEQEPVEAAPNQ